MPHSPIPSSQDGFRLFDTPVGRCGIAWGGDGILGFQLPEDDDARTRARLLKSAPGACEREPPADVADAIAGVLDLLAGRPDELRAVRLDMAAVPPFHRRVYEVARTIAPGATLTYGEIAARLDEPEAARAVGQALGSNPFAVIVPCHRVLAAGGRTGGFSAGGGVETKLRLLAIEGVVVGDGPTLFDHAGVAPEPRPRRAPRD